MRSSAPYLAMWWTKRRQFSGVSTNSAGRPGDTPPMPANGRPGRRRRYPGDRARSGRRLQPLPGAGRPPTGCVGPSGRHGSDDCLGRHGLAEASSGRTFASDGCGRAPRPRRGGQRVDVFQGHEVNSEMRPGAASLDNLLEGGPSARDQNRGAIRQGPSSRAPWRCRTQRPWTRAGRRPAS